MSQYAQNDSFAVHSASKRFSYSAVVVLLAALLAPVFSSTFTHASNRLERLNAIDWFVYRFVYPKQICAVAGEADLARLEEVLADIRKDNLQVFELIEQSREYVATITTIKALDAERPQWSQRYARNECSKYIFFMIRDHKSGRNTEMLKNMLDLFSSAT